MALLETTGLVAFSDSLTLVPLGTVRTCLLPIRGSSRAREGRLNAPVLLAASGCAIAQ